MPVYSVEGKLGTGKTKFCVWRAQQALGQGRRVASNVDLYMQKLCPTKRATYIRLPDKPRAFDLEAIGHGNPESYDEGRNGVLLLDELGTWLNSRSYQDKDRAGVLDWLIHARKLGWDVYLIVQNAGMIDKQVRESLIEYQCRCLRLDKVRIPLLGSFLPGKLGYLPRLHSVAARVGEGANAIVAERWHYRGDELHACYDTRQVFVSRDPMGPDWFGPHSVLPPWDWSPKLSLLARLRAAWRPASGKGGGTRSAPPLKPKLPAVRQLEALSPEVRIRVWRELEARGVLEVDHSDGQALAAS